MDLKITKFIIYQRIGRRATEGGSTREGETVRQKEGGMEREGWM